MKFFVSFVFFVQIIWVDGSFFPKNALSLVESEGFLAYMLPISDFGALASCKVTVQGESYFLEPVTVAKLPSGTEILRYSRTQCGGRVKKVSKSVEGTWSFEAVDDRGRTDASNLTITVLTVKVEPSIKNITVPFDGSFSRITCPNANGARYCDMANNDGGQFPNTCEMGTTLTARTNMWTCSVFFWGNMNSYDGIVNVLPAEPKKNAITELYETDRHVVLSCKVERSASQCRAEMPDKRKKLFLMDGLLTDHYSVYDTVQSKGQCSLEIEKPLRPEDIGIWRIYFDFGVNEINYIGCVFDVKDVAARSRFGLKSRRRRSNRENPTTIEVLGGRTTTTTISCEVPYEINYCYLQPPVGSSDDTEFVPINFQNTRYLGQCHFKVVNITAGQWVCGMNDEANGEDRLTYYQVIVHDQPAQVMVEKIQADRGDGVKLLCKTVMQIPMNFCRFVTPAGVVHGLSRATRSSEESRYHYFGGGLGEGECGIEIDQVEASDFGSWACTFQIDAKEYTLRMELEKETLSMAATWGLGIGLALLVMLGSGFVGHRYFMRSGPGYRAARNPNVVHHRRQSVSDVSSESHNS